MASPLVSIVIVNWNGLEDTRLCLDYTRRQTYPNTEIIVVDNGSEDGSLNYLRKQKDIKLVENPKNLGFTGGHIAGYKASSGDYILLLNNDAVMDKQYIELAVGTMASDQHIGAIGGRAYLWDENNNLFDRTNDFYAYQNINPITAEGIFTKHDLGVKQSVNVVSGSCVMVRREIIEYIGYLHNPFFAYFEESDLFARMKRAGYKVIYDPQLAIWHANAKTSSKKAPTFFYYMIMRNRFRFALRNFDNWSLLRFLKFYLKMGIASIIKSVLPLGQRPMHQAYAKAFLYNLIFGWKALIERFELKKTLGKSSYNRLIVREQTGISIIIACNTMLGLERLIELGRELQPNDELLIVTSNSSVEKELKRAQNLPAGVRLCVDRGYFETHQQNLGAVCARNEWLLIGQNRALSLRNAFSHFSKNIYLIQRSGKKLSGMIRDDVSFRSFGDALTQQISQELLIKRDLFIDEGGLDKALPLSNAKRQILAYSFLTKTFFPLSVPKLRSLMPTFSGLINISDLDEKLSIRLKQAKAEYKTKTIVDKVADRYYRFAQSKILLTWLFYWRIPIRLKLGRLKNLVLAAITINLSKVAMEIKHMGNELILHRDALDMVAVRQKEQERLQFLLNHPDETISLIILRDRYEPLKKLLKWLESQDMKKIVLIDNDSKLPPLIDFLNKTDYQVLELARNMTQTAPWSAGIIKVLLPDDFYILTDPDIIPTRDTKDVISYLYKLHSKHPYYLKIGLGLKIDDLPDHYLLKDQVIKWESQFWKHELEEGVYEAGIDTTFALYKPHTYKYVLNPSLRTGEPYTARHLPWYTKKNELTDEEVFYRLRADQSVNSWNKSHLPERYKKELEKQR